MSSMPRRAADDLQQAVFMQFDIAAAADADRTDKLFTVPPGKRFRVDYVEIIMPAGLAEDATNAALLALKANAVTVASHNTDSDLSEADASIPADTPFPITLSATDTDLVAQAGEVFSWVIDESGTTTVPAHKLNVFGRFV